MNLNYAWKLRLKIWKTNVGAQKINGFILEIFGIVITDFQISDKIGRSRFFQKNFLIANIKFQIYLKLFFLKISNADVLFNKKTLMWKSYTIKEVLSITKQI